MEGTQNSITKTKKQSPNTGAYANEITETKKESPNTGVGAQGTINLVFFPFLSQRPQPWLAWTRPAPNLSPPRSKSSGSIKSFVVWDGNVNHLGAQGTINPAVVYVYTIVLRTRPNTLESGAPASVATVRLRSLPP